MQIVARRSTGVARQCSKRIQLPVHLGTEFIGVSATGPWCAEPLLLTRLANGRRAAVEFAQPVGQLVQVVAEFPCTCELPRQTIGFSVTFMYRTCHPIADLLEYTRDLFECLRRSWRHGRVSPLRNGCAALLASPLIGSPTHRVRRLSHPVGKPLMLEFSPRLACRPPNRLGILS